MISYVHVYILDTLFPTFSLCSVLRIKKKNEASAFVFSIKQDKRAAARTHYINDITML